MLGSVLSRVLMMVFGYAYPAYKCFKIVEKNKPEIDQLLSWCHYWILLATLTVFERPGDFFFSWLPFYDEAKLGLFVYLWSSNMRGTKYLYSCFFQPFMARHEAEIDRYICELRAKAETFAILYWKKALILGQSRFSEVLQSVSSHDHQEASSRTGLELEAVRTEPIITSSQQKTADKKSRPLVRYRWRIFRSGHDHRPINGA